MKYIDITTSNLAGAHSKLLLCHLKALSLSTGDTFELNKVARETHMEYAVARDACNVLRNRGIIASVDVETFTILKPLIEQSAAKVSKKGPVPPHVNVDAEN